MGSTSRRDPLLIKYLNPDKDESFVDESNLQSRKKSPLEMLAIVCDNIVVNDMLPCDHNTRETMTSQEDGHRQKIRHSWPISGNVQNRKRSVHVDHSMDSTKRRKLEEYCSNKYTFFGKQMTDSTFVTSTPSHNQSQDDELQKMTRPSGSTKSTSRGNRLSRDSLLVVDVQSQLEDFECDRRRGMNPLHRFEPAWQSGFDSAQSAWKPRTVLDLTGEEVRALPHYPANQRENKKPDIQRLWHPLMERNDSTQPSFESSRSRSPDHFPLSLSSSPSPPSLSPTLSSSSPGAFPALSSEMPMTFQAQLLLSYMINNSLLLDHLPTFHEFRQLYLQYLLERISLIHAFKQ